MAHVHLIGIGGTGLSAIARVLVERGYVVTGSDRSLSPLAQELVGLGVRVWTGHQAENVRGADVVVRSSAVPDDNVEVQAARAAGIPVVKRSDFLGKLMQGQQVIAVAGTHGKTTTTAMIAWMLTRLGLDPSYIIGGTLKNLGSNAHAGQGAWFVIEADEYDRMFLGLNPDVAVITYLEHDHPDCYPSMDDYRAAFAAFTRRLSPSGLLLAAHDQPETLALVRHVAQEQPADSQQIALTYGQDPAANYCAENVTRNARGGFDYDACHSDPNMGRTWLAHVSLQAPGRHNVLNSLAALVVAQQIIGLAGLPAAAAALGEFSGTGRRFEILGEAGGVTVIDDYAHHPTEIQATLAAARARYAGGAAPRRIWAVWQPHTFSRSRTLLEQFAAAFGDADRVVVSEIYASREKAVDFDHFSALRVVERMQHPGVQFVPTLEGITAMLLNELQPGDVLLVLSAGDADQISAQVLQTLRQRDAAQAQKEEV